MGLQGRIEHLGGVGLPRGDGVPLLHPPAAWERAAELQRHHLCLQGKEGVNGIRIPPSSVELIDSFSLFLFLSLTFFFSLLQTD